MSHDYRCGVRTDTVFFDYDPLQNSVADIEGKFNEWLGNLEMDVEEGLERKIKGVFYSEIPGDASKSVIVYNVTSSTQPIQK